MFSHIQAMIPKIIANIEYGSNNPNCIFYVEQIAFYLKFSKSKITVSKDRWHV